MKKVLSSLLAATLVIMPTLASAHQFHTVSSLTDRRAKLAILDGQTVCLPAAKSGARMCTGPKGLHFVAGKKPTTVKFAATAVVAKPLASPFMESANNPVDEAAEIASLLAQMAKKNGSI